MVTLFLPGLKPHTVNKISLTSFVPRVHGMLLNIYLASRPPLFAKTKEIFLVHLSSSPWRYSITQIMSKFTNFFEESKSLFKKLNLKFYSKILLKNWVYFPIIPYKLQSCYSKFWVITVGEIFYSSVFNWIYSGI